MATQNTHNRNQFGFAQARNARPTRHATEHETQAENPSSLFRHFIAQAQRAILRILTHVNTLRNQIPILEYLAANKQASTQIRRMAAINVANGHVLYLQFAALYNVAHTLIEQMQQQLANLQALEQQANVNPAVPSEHATRTHDLPQFELALSQMHDSVHSALVNETLFAISRFVQQSLANVVLASVENRMTQHCEFRRDGDGNQDGAGPFGGAGGCGVSAMTAGYPEAITTAAQGYDQGWDTQVRFFTYGTPIAHDVHHRRYNFTNDGRVDIQAHIPIAVFKIDIAGDRRLKGVWQGYTARFFCGTDTSTPWGIRHFYGLNALTGVSTVGNVDTAFDVSWLPNFAFEPNAYTWHRWWLTDARERPTQFDGCGSDSGEPNPDLLLQAMSGFAPEGIGAGSVFGTHSRAESQYVGLQSSHVGAS